MTKVSTETLRKEDNARHHLQMNILSKRVEGFEEKLDMFMREMLNGFSDIKMAMSDANEENYKKFARKSYEKRVDKTETKITQIMTTAKVLIWLLSVNGVLLIILNIWNWLKEML